MFVIKQVPKVVDHLKYNFIVLFAVNKNDKSVNLEIFLR